jgi:hypothetical protein
MKLACPFCKTEYDAAASGTLVQCVCCGCIWRSKKKKRFPALWLMSVVCFVLAASIFAGVVYVRSAHTEIKEEQRSLVIRVTNVRTVQDALGEPHFVISGTVSNLSDEIYGVPYLIIILRDDNGNELARQKFLPPVPLLGMSETADFAHTFGQVVPDARKVSVEFDEDGRAGTLSRRAIP